MCGSFVADGRFCFEIYISMKTKPQGTSLSWYTCIHLRIVSFYTRNENSASPLYHVDGMGLLAPNFDQTRYLRDLENKPTEDQFSFLSGKSRLQQERE